MLAVVNILTVLCLRCCCKHATTPVTLARPRTQGHQSALRANEKAAATLFMVTRGRQYQYILLLLGARCRWVALVSCSSAIYHLNFSGTKVIQNTDMEGIPPKFIRHPACVRRMTKNSHIWHVLVCVQF